MASATIVEWTDAQVQLRMDACREVKYRVYRDANRNYLEVRGDDDLPIHTLELPDGMKLDRSSYEVLLRYVLLDVAAA